MGGLTGARFATEGLLLLVAPGLGLWRSKRLSSVLVVRLLVDAAGTEIDDLRRMGIEDFGVIGLTADLGSVRDSVEEERAVLVWPPAGQIETARVTSNKIILNFIFEYLEMAVSSCLN